MTSNKIGFNVESLCFDTSQQWPWRWDCAQGFWLPTKGEPNPVVLGRWMDVGCNWLRYGSGTCGNQYTVADAVMNGFTLLDFMRCCQIANANPIIQLPIWQPPQVSVDLVKLARKSGYAGKIYLEVGNEPWWSQAPVGGQYLFSASDYIPIFNAIYDAIPDHTGLEFGVPFIDSNEWDVPGRKEWDGQIWDALNDKMQWVSVHQYSTRPSHYIEVLGRIAKRTSGLPMIVTEWNYEGYHEKMYLPEMRNFILATLKILEGIPEVIGHTIWDSSCAGYWKLFEQDNKPLPAWEAYEMFKSET